MAALLAALVLAVPPQWPRVPRPVYAPTVTLGLRLVEIDALPRTPGRALLTATYGSLAGRQIFVSEGRRLCGAANYGHNHWLGTKRVIGASVEFGSTCYRPGGRCTVADGLRYAYTLRWRRGPVRFLLIAHGVRLADLWRFVASFAPVR